MALEMNLWTMVDITLRVPPVFVMDAALKYGWETSRKKVHEFVENTVVSWNHGPINESCVSSEWWLHPSKIEELGFNLVAFVLYIQVFLTAIFAFLFTTKQLVVIYIRVASMIIIAVVFELNSNYVKFEVNRIKHGQNPLLMEEIPSHSIILSVLAILFAFTNTGDIISHVAVWTMFFAPLLACVMPISMHTMELTPTLSAFGCFFLVTYSTWLHGLKVCENVYRAMVWCHRLVENHGLYAMIETHWGNLHIPQVFRIFWVIRLTDYILITLENSSQPSTLHGIIKGSIIHGSENTIALLGMTSILSLACQIFGYSIQAFLQLDDPAEKNIGTITAVIFLILSVQTGVTRKEPQSRYIELCRNYCLIVTSLMHFVYHIVNPILLSLGASNHPSFGKHARALITSSLPIIIPTLIIWNQWHFQTQLVWLAAITSFMAELIIKSTVSIIIYILFIIDASKNGLWENLDDYIFYLKFTASSTEFFIGLYLLCNGVWMFIFGSTSVIRGTMICLHAYFNIWIPGKKGLESIKIHHSAINKIRSLQIATKEQLRKKKDVCAICFQELNAARITSCNHYFHGACLRKWLNVQETCPLCHNVLFQP